MVKFGGEIGTLYQIFTPCTPLPKYKRAFTLFWVGSNILLFLCSLDPKKYFFSTFFGFFIITAIFNAQKSFLKNSPHDVQTKGGGQRPFEQC